MSWKGSTFRGGAGRATVGCAAAVLVSSCIELVPVAPPPAHPAILHLFIRLGDAVAAGEDAAPVRVSATLEPGIDEAGVLRIVTNDTLRVLDHVLEPVEVGNRGQRVYSAELVVEPGRLLAEPVTLQPPGVNGALAPLQIVRWPVATRLDPDPIVLPEGSDLVLEVGLTEPVGDPVPSFRRWSISVFRTGAWSSRGGDGLLPTRIRVPADQLGPAGGSVVAIANLSQSAEISSQPGEYATRLEISQEIRWNVRIEED